MLAGTARQERAGTNGRRRLVILPKSCSGGSGMCSSATSSALKGAGTGEGGACIQRDVMPKPPMGWRRRMRTSCRWPFLLPVSGSSYSSRSSLHPPQ